MRTGVPWLLRSTGLAVLTAVALGLALPAAAQTDPCWYEFCEYHELGDADPLSEKLLLSYGEASCLVVVDPSPIPADPYQMVTWPIRTLTPGGNLPMCSNDPWWDQPHPARPGDWNFSASGMLVGQRHVLTAKHVIEGILNSQFGYECSDIAFVFDFRKEDESIPNDQIPTTVALDNVRWCANYYLADGDWAIVTLDRPLPPSRIPVKVRRFGAPVVGDEIAVIGHPERVPVKASLGLITAVNALGLYADRVPESKGGSGSMFMDRFTGKVEAVVQTGLTAVQQVPDVRPPCYRFCYEPGCATVPNTTSYTRGFPMEYEVINGPRPGIGSSQMLLPRIGLQVHPEHDLDEIYGPPGGPFPGFEADNTKEYTLSVPSTDFRTVRYSLKDWRPVGAPPILAPFLDPDESTSFVLDLENPPPWMVVDISTPGTYHLDQVFSDITYHSFEPRRQTLHVGEYGFAVTPLETESTGRGNGIEFVLENRWMVPQEVTVEVVQDGSRSNVAVDGSARKRVVLLGPVGDPSWPAHHTVLVSLESDGTEGPFESSAEATVRFTSTWRGEIQHAVERRVVLVKEAGRNVLSDK